MTSFDRTAAEAQMIADAAVFHRFGWLLGTSGNLSIRRDTATFLISASGKDKGRLLPGDFLVCDLDGEPAEQTSERPSAETLVHCEIYRRFPGAGAVYHVHEPHAALCSGELEHDGFTRFQGLEMIKGLDVWEADAVVDVPVVPNHHDIPRLARAVAAAVAGTDTKVPAVNIDRHGYYAWGEDAFAAKRHVETLAYLFRYVWEASR